MFKKSQALLWEGPYYVMIHPLERNILFSVIPHRLNMFIYMDNSLAFTS